MFSVETFSLLLTFSNTAMATVAQLYAAGTKSRDRSPNWANEHGPPKNFSTLRPVFLFKLDLNIPTSFFKILDLICFDHVKISIFLVFFPSKNVSPSRHLLGCGPPGAAGPGRRPARSCGAPTSGPTRGRLRPTWDLRLGGGMGGGWLESGGKHMILMCQN